MEAYMNRIKIATGIPWHSRRFTLPIERIRRCERFGFDAVFTAEGMGNDAITPLGYVAAITNRMKLGTHIATVTARPPTVLAQGLMTIDAMAGGGRIIAGVGGGFPGVSEGWHGRPWGKPIRRMRDYVDVLRQAFATSGSYDAEGNAIETTELYAEETRSLLGAGVQCQSSEFSIPYAGTGSIGAQPWVSTLDRGPQPPIVVAAVGPRMISLAAEIADGWFPVGFAPGMMHIYEPHLAAGFARAKPGKLREDFDIWAIVDVLVTDDVKFGIDVFRSYLVEWPELLHFQTDALGYPGLGERIAELVAEGRREEALASVPDEYIDQTFLIGSHSRIANRLKLWFESGATGLIFRYGPQVQVGAHQLVEDLDVWETIGKAAHAF
jgi:alkanesulfonate monooxygenase SsuD/methylene tetrahydromethanopterin reductase-like flavin-dependent oxidoreductase (luciferase family)